MVSFIREFNAGDVRRLNHTIAARPEFHWYSVSGDAGQRLNEQAFNRSSLMYYFAARHARHEHLTLTSYKFEGKQDSYGNFQYRLTRQADDLANGTPVSYLGKGALNCRVARIAIWSMGSATTITGP